MKKALMIAVIAAGILVAGVTAVKANEPDRYPPMMQRLVEKFGLNEDEVKAVFDEERVQHQEQMRLQHEEQLNQVVSEGKITEEQKQAILAKQEEMRANMGQFKDLTPEERQEQRQTHQEEMQAWAEANSINLEDLRGLMGGLGGPRGGFGKGMKFDQN